MKAIIMVVAFITILGLVGNQEFNDLCKQDKNCHATPR